MKKIILSALVIFILVSCKSKKVVTENITAIETTTTVSSEISMADRIAQGESIFQNKCGNCHDLPKVKDHSPENWKPIMLRMQKEAEISDNERDYVYDYIVMQ
jgi:cytochrome c5